MFTKKVFVSGILLFSLVLGACAQVPGKPQVTPPETNPTPNPTPQLGIDLGYNWFVAQLKANGATILSTDEVQQPFFPIKAKVLTVNGASVQVFEFAGEAERQSSQTLISLDGSTVGDTKVQVDPAVPVRFWSTGRIIVLYAGKEQALVDLLTKVLGDPITTPSLPPVDVNTPAVQAAIQQLSVELGISADQIEVVSIEEVQWPDGCLGLPKPNEACTLAEVPGYRVTLSAQGNTYILRTDLEGKQVRQEPTIQSEEPTPAPSIGGLYTIQVTAAIEQLKAFLKDDTVQIEVISSEQVDFSDSCLGLGQPNEGCLAVITPGWKILLSANGQVYEFHTTLDAKVVRMKPLESNSVVTPTASLPAAITAAIQNLSATKGIHVDQIAVVSYEHKQWSDACLGINLPGIGCAMVITPGWLVILSAQGQTYEYHTNETGTIVRLKQ